MRLTFSCFIIKTRGMNTVKKILCVIFAAFVLNCALPPYSANAEELNSLNICYAPVNSLRYKINSIKKEIRLNENKIKRIQNSKNISENEKKRRISRLETRNKYLKRELNKIRYEYSRALS